MNNIPWRKEEKLKELRTKVIDKTKKDLLNELTSAGHHVPKKDRGKKAGMIPWATKYRIELTKIVPAHISESWVGKPKGMGLHSKRARYYMVTYFIMSIEGENGTNGEISLDEMKPCAVSTSKKTHRAAIDFDKSFCKAKVVVKIEKVIDN